MRKAGWIILAVLVAGLAPRGLIGCGGDGGTEPGGGDGSEVSWGYGESRTFEIPASTSVTVVDSASSAMFRLPTGGGLFTVRDIIDGPTTLPDEGDFEIDYTGTSTVELLMSHDPGDIVYLMGYAPLTGVVLEDAEPDTSGWLPLSASETLSGATGDTLVFELPFTDNGRTLLPLSGSSVKKYKRLVYKKGTAHAALVAQVEANIRDAINSLIYAIPPARRPEVRTRIDVDMRPIFVVPQNRAAYFWTAKPKYIPYLGLPGILPIYKIVIPDDCLNNVAHEVSHYLHHVLIQGGFAAFAWNSRPGHKVGTTGAFGQLIEDFAYLGEYYLNGNVSDANPRWGSTLAGTDESAKSPKTTDFRDLEGMAVAIFAAHTRDTDRMNDYRGIRRTVPVISGDVTEKFQDCYEIVAQGTDDMLEVVEKMEAILATKYDQADALPAMLEPLGWSHHIKCRFVDAEGEPVANVEARSVCKTGGQEHYLPRRGTPSGNDGRYTLDEFHPGKSTLRIYQGTDSTDVAEITIPWSRATNQEQDLGDIYIEGDSGLLEKLRGCGGMYGSATGNMAISGADPEYVGFGFIICSRYGQDCDSLKWNGVEGRYGCTRTFEDTWEREVERDSMYVRAAIDGRSLEILYLRTERTSLTFAGGYETIRITEIELADVPVLYYPGDQWANDDFIFSLESEEMASHVNRAYYKNWSSGFGGVESSTFLSSPYGTGITFEHYTGCKAMGGD